jgi:hypothetical protein
MAMPHRWHVWHCLTDKALDCLYREKAKDARAGWGAQYLLAGTLVLRHRAVVSPVRRCLPEPVCWWCRSLIKRRTAITADVVAQRPHLEAASPLFTQDGQRFALCTREGWILAADGWDAPRCVFNYPAVSGGGNIITQIQSDAEGRRVGCYVTSKIQPNCCHRVLAHRLIYSFLGLLNLLLLFEVGQSV